MTDRFDLYPTRVPASRWSLAPRLFLTGLFLALSLWTTGCGDDGNNTESDISDAAEISGDIGADVDDDAADLADGEVGDATDTGDIEGDTGDDPPGEFGPWPVGYMQLTVTYDPVGPETERTLPIEVWYPAVDGGEPPAAYSVAGIVSVPPYVALDSPAAADGSFPLVVYSHGSGGEGLVGYPYGEWFASDGWVVIAPDHVGNTATDGVAGTSAPFATNVLNRVTDISAILDAAESDLDEPSLTGRINMDEVFVFGHSFGAYTTLAAAGGDISFDALQATCSTADGSCDYLEDAEVEDAFRAGFGDPRIDAIAPQAPALVPLFDDLGTNIEIPVMLQTARLDRTTTQEEQSVPAWMALDGQDDVWVEMPDGGHFTFITICDDLEPSLIEAFRPDAPEDGCGPEFIPTSVAVPVLGEYLRAWARWHVLGEVEAADTVTGAPLEDGFVITLKGNE